MGSMVVYLSPGVYVEELSPLQSTVEEVATAVPAFVGYTEKARNDAAEELTLRPTLVRSLFEYESLFGGPRADPIAIAVAASGAGGFAVVRAAMPTLRFLLWFSVRMFFENGGARCSIVSVGDYGAAVAQADLLAGLDRVQLEDEPTLLVVPEAVSLDSADDYATVVRAMLAQCGARQDRFAILDLHGGGAELDSAALHTARGRFGADHLMYGAAYHPFLDTVLGYHVDAGRTNVQVEVDGAAPIALGTLETTSPAAFAVVASELANRRVTLPPSGAIAGVYAATDAERGVWRAPANRSLSSVSAPSIAIDNRQQASLNVDAATGISINAIRAFPGRGTLIWGARTLAGSDNEWRYVCVRRFFNMVEESIRRSTRFAMFEPNEEITWLKLRGMIEHYLLGKWRAGALVGATPREAFFVRCGVGTTMTGQDIADGRLIVEVGLAAVRPAEFVLLRIEQMVATS
jgi:phage tail sheath protein FI